MAAKLAALDFHVVGTSRNQKFLEQHTEKSYELINFTKSNIEKNLSSASHILVSTPPSSDFGDPVLAHFVDLIKKYARSSQWLGYLLGTIIEVNSATWYQTLHKSSLTPPAIVFPIVWSILYAMVAISGWYLWQHRHQPQAKTALGFYSAQMLFNWAWSPLFFNFHLIAVSFYFIILIALLTLKTILLTKNNFKLSSIMLMPYFIWFIFASYLNGVLWMLN